MLTLIIRMNQRHFSPAPLPNRRTTINMKLGVDTPLAKSFTSGERVMGSKIDICHTSLVSTSLNGPRA